MPNPKSRPEKPPRPQPVNGLFRKSELDAWLDRHLPIPTQVVSNEEYLPIPQLEEQRRVEHAMVQTARQCAARLGMDRRRFLRTSCGMAAAFAAMNSVFGPFFRLEAAELFEPAAVAENKTRYFIFDVQTHHVAMPAQAPQADPGFMRAVRGMRGMARKMDPNLKAAGEPELQEAYLENYVKEVFLDSETDLAVLSGLPSATEEANVLPPDVIARTKSWVNEITRSKRVISHGLFSPDRGTQNLEAMQVQHEKLKIDAWKGYAGVGMAPGSDGWFIDDEKVSYPALEYSRKAGIRNICLHKGLPFPGPEKYWSPMDVVKASRDFPDLNFLIYHAGFKSVAEAMPAARGEFKETSYVPWVSDICEARRKNPHMKNVYMELGSTFALMVSSSPLLCAHVLGMAIQSFGEDNVLWGTDSIWWGSPQWQIEAFRRFQIPESLQKQFDYQPLTSEVKAKIFGLNGARVYRVDPEAVRHPIPDDYIDRLRRLYQQSGMAQPSNTQYGWAVA